MPGYTVAGLIGRKVGMLQWFDGDGRVWPLTILRVGPCVVTRVRTPERDGYPAVQIGLLEPVKVHRLNRPLQGYLKKHGLPLVRKLVEFPALGEVRLGQQITVADVFQTGEKVDVVGWTKGRGFQGGVHRHGFRGGPASHGSKVHRRPGSIGTNTDPGRVLKGKRMAGRMASRRLKVRNLRIVLLVPEEHVLGVMGSVPGAPNGYVYVLKAKSTLAGQMEEYTAVRQRLGG
ncbi:MAG: 50S ribosomal protein L3 [Acidobacteria bacterium]|nr:50S ribosomal protein L3 [Acidobacteriota bacterium]MDW7984369.1 50S ribosomal protein L3 [Acidobacteriota bacterium]